MSEEAYKYKREIDYLKDFPGADIEKDAIKVIIDGSNLEGVEIDLIKVGGEALTGRDISTDLANLDIALTALRDAIRGVGEDNFSTLKGVIETQLDITLSTLAIALQGTGEDDFTTLKAAINAALDITLSALRDALQGTGEEDLTTLKAAVEALNGGATISIIDAGDASAGVSADLQDFEVMTLYIIATAACNVTVELSPEGTAWYGVDDSPYNFAGAGTKVIELPYAATDIKITSSTADNLTAKIRGVY